MNATAESAVETGGTTGQESRDVYTEFFGLNEKPFAITPDPRYLYMSARHTDALAHLVYGISESGGFIQLTGEVGTGKTTLIRSLLEQLPEKADIALILSPQLTTLEFLETIIDELHCAQPAERTVKAQIDVLNAHLMSAHAAGRRVVLIVDEAQTLSPELLEQVRLLTNLETAKQKLLQIILIGQPELRDLLDRSEMRQIAQRITGRYHLEPLTKHDTHAYVNHRLRVAGAQSDIFTRAAVRTLHRYARGIPRLINVIADRTLLAAYTRDRRTVDASLVRAAAAEVFGIRRKSTPWWPIATATAGALALLFGVSTLNRNRPEHDPLPLTTSSSVVPLAAAPSPPSAPPPVAIDVEPSPIVTAAETAPAPPSPPPTLQSLLAEPRFALGTDAAVGELLTLWGGRYEPGRGEPCRQAEEQGLRCAYQSRGSLGELRRVNWPAVLALVSDDGMEHSVVVASLGYDAAELVANGVTFELPLAELGYHWYGNHLLLWRPGEAPATDLAPGDTDEGVRWLRAILAKLAGEPEPGAAASTVYDAALERRVRAFQREHQLTVDGIVGARTQIALLAKLGVPDSPRLVAEH